MLNFQRCHQHKGFKLARVNKKNRPDNFSVQKESPNVSFMFATYKVLERCDGDSSWTLELQSKLNHEALSKQTFQVSLVSKLNTSTTVSARLRQTSSPVCLKAADQTAPAFGKFYGRTHAQLIKCTCWAHSQIRHGWSSLPPPFLPLCTLISGKTRSDDAFFDAKAQYITWFQAILLRCTEQHEVKIHSEQGWMWIQQNLRLFQEWQ